MPTDQILIAFGILALVASLMVCMFVDLMRLLREVEIDELWNNVEIESGERAA